MVIANVTPVSPFTLPYTWTVQGQAYSLSSAQGAGCVDTVTPLTANAGGVYNVKGVPLYPIQAYAVVQNLNYNQPGAATVCQSLMNQLTTSGGGSLLGGNQLDMFPTIGFNNWILDDITGFGLALFGIGVFIFAFEKLTGRKIK